MISRPKLYKKIMTVIKDKTGVIRVIEKVDEDFIVYYVQSAISKTLFSKIKKLLTPDLIEKLEKSKKIGEIEEIKTNKDKYEISWTI